MPIKINPAHEGLLHEEMGIAKGKKISIAALRAKKKRDKASGNTAGLKRDVFAINAKTKFNK